MTERLFPDFELPEAARAEAIRRMTEGGGTFAESNEMVDLTVHAINEAIATFERVCQRHSHPAYSTMALLNGIHWLELYAGQLTRAGRKAVVGIPGIKLHED